MKTQPPQTTSMDKRCPGLSHEAVKWPYWAKAPENMGETWQESEVGSSLELGRMATTPPCEHGQIAKMGQIFIPTSEKFPNSSVCIR